MTDTNQWNPRFLEFARFNGNPPEQQQAGFLFILWNTERLREFKSIHPECFSFGSLTNHTKYDEWLPTRVDELLKVKEKA